MYSERGRIRELLVEHYQRVDDLDAFIMDHFLHVYRAFGPGWSRQQKVNLLLELIEPAKVCAALGIVSQDLDAQAAPPQSIREPASPDEEDDLYAALMDGATDVEVVLRNGERARVIPIIRLRAEQQFDWTIAVPPRLHTLRISGRRTLATTTEKGVLHDAGRKSSIKLDANGARHVIYGCRASRQQIDLHISSGATLGDVTLFDLGERCVVTLRRQVAGSLCVLMARSANSEQAAIFYFVG